MAAPGCAVYLQAASSSGAASRGVAPAGQKEDCATSSTGTNHRAPASADRACRERQAVGNGPLTHASAGTDSSAGSVLSRGRRQAVYLCRGCVLRISVILCGDSDGVAQISQ